MCVLFITDYTLYYTGYITEHTICVCVCIYIYIYIYIYYFFSCALSARMRRLCRPPQNCWVIFRRRENMVGVNVVLASFIKFKNGLYKSCGIECVEGIMLEPFLLQPYFHVAGILLGHFTGGDYSLRKSPHFPAKLPQQMGRTNNKSRLAKFLCFRH